ncbi:MAG: hypothetical protein IPP17_10750 [Bacteroidetes bacterium]|nr:hypothetical protein [Bacteroidota bacterium]
MKKVLVWCNQDRNTFALLLTLLLIDRIVLLSTFNFKFVGSDDLIFWQGATDYLHGQFHEPYFYGQNYNFMLESLFAVPLLLLRIPHFYALPISSTFLAMFPFVYFSRKLFKNGFKVEGMVFLVIPVLLPIEYGILTSITRGFISGLFFCSFLAPALMHPSKKSGWLLAALSFALGYIFNPNSLVFSLPVMLYLLTLNYRQISFYAINLLAIVPVLLLEFWAKSFYVSHPEYIVHRMWEIQFDFGKIFENFSSLDKFFGYFTPLIWPLGWLILVVILLLGIYQLKRDWRKGLSLIFGIVFIVITLGINKVNDNIDTIFLSSTRMFLGIPLLSGLAFFWNRDLLKVSDKYLKFGMVAMVVTVVFSKSSFSEMVVNQHVNKAVAGGAMPVKRKRHLEQDCAKLAELASKEKIDLIVFVPNWEHNVPNMEFYNYGCPLVQEAFPKTIMNVYERRTWVYLAERSTVESNVLLYNFALDSIQIDSFTNARTVSTNPNLTLISGNKLPLDSLLKQLSLGLKRHSYE